MTSPHHHHHARNQNLHYGATTENYSPLSCSIMNYYKRFGQNRDLEKFLRLHRSYSNKSSSESSLYCPTTTTTTHFDGGCGDGNNINNPNKIPISEECFGRSLQNLSILKNNDPGEEFNKSNLSSARSKSGSRLHSCSDGETDVEEPIVEKSLITKDTVSKSKKGVNVNFESFIEINMPQQTSGVALPPPPIPHISTLQAGPPAQIFISPIAQTQPKIITSSEKFVQTFIEEESPIVPSTTAKITSSNLGNAQPQSIDAETNYSPTSSITSQHKQKLEWDSGADVGYSKKIDSSDAGLSSLERNALTKLFANFGLSLDSNIILLSSKKAETAAVESETTDLAAKEKERRGKAIRDKWKIVSEGIMRQEKGRRSMMTQTSKLDVSEMKISPDMHSTPYMESVNLQEINKVSRTEKFSQTSMTELRTQSVQVSRQTSIETKEDSLNVSQSTKKSSRSPSINNDSLGKYENEGESQKSSPSSLIDHGPDVNKNQSREPEETDAESFEFVSGIEYLKKSNEKPEKNRKSNGENHSKTSSPSTSFSLSKYDKNLPENYQKMSRLEKNLTVGINLINTLLESSSLSTDSKTVLIKKIITKLEKMVKRNCTDVPSDEHMRTIENIKLKISAEPEKLSESEITRRTPTLQSSSETVTPVTSTKNENNKRPSSEDLKRKTHEKLEKITADLNVTKNEWLKPITHSELNYEMNTKRSVENTGRNNVKLTERSEKDIQLSLITANIKYLEKLKVFLENGGNAENFLGGSEIKFNVDSKRSSKSNGTDSKLSQRSSDSHPSKSDFPTSSAATSFSWNSHSNLNKKSTRSKLETPTTSLDESVNTFARHKKEEFIEKYSRMMQKNLEPIKVIYTKPYSGTSANEYYSNPNKIDRHGRPIPPSKSKNTATSLNSSEIFMSSMYLPPHSQTNSCNSKSTTSQLRFDMLNIGTQTSESIKMTTPIFGDKIHEKRSGHTKMVKNVCSKNKLSQITPRPISYMLRFDNDGSSTIRDQGTHDENKRAPIIMVDSTTTTTRSGSNLFNINNNLEANLKHLSNDFSLQNSLIEKNRNFLARAEERRQYIQDVNRLRKLRNEQRTEILKLDPNISIKSKLENLPSTRIHIPGKQLFTTRQLRMQTRKKYRTLPEVVQQKENYRGHQIKRNNKRIVEIFNKNLQKKVLKGKVSLSHSLALV